MVLWGDMMQQIMSNNIIAAPLIEREQQLDCDDTVNIQFTSGTTGYPKGVTLSHHNVLNNSYYIGEALQITEKDSICNPTPLFHCFGMVIGNLVALNYGAQIVYPSASFDARASLQAAADENCTTLYGVPTMFNQYLAEIDKNLTKYDLSRLSKGLVAGSVCTEPLIKKLHEKLNLHGLCNVYGMTELSPIATMMGPDAPF